ncbi:MFS transporter [Eubacterium sp.]|uniref:MFS transporter n=1 Tax=Eubacterium sp. TaxID=142586 RepID=UPI003F0021FF
MNKLFEKAKTLVLDIGTYWNKPREGEYVTNKEFAKFVVGASGSNTAAYAGGNLTFTAGCLFVGAIYGLKMMDFVMLGFVGLILGYLFSPINMIITDNLGTPPKKTMRLINWASLAFFVVGVACFFVPQKYFEGFMPALPQVVGTKFLIQVFTTYWNMFVLKKLSPKFGKYRSWILAGIIPYIASLMLLVWFPYNTLEYHEKFWVMNLFFAFWGCFGTCFGQINNIQNVISPNTNERTRIMSIGSFLYSLLPSIYNVVFPIVAAKMGGLTDIKTYRYAVPGFVIVSAPLALFLVFGIKDRVVQEVEHKPQVDMKHGFKEVLRNKYLWITNISGWITTFSAGAINIVNMLIIYALRQDWVLGIMATILGTAWTPGMLLAPWLIKKFGKKRIMLFCKYVTIACSFLSIVGVYLDSFLIIIVSTYISTMLTSVVGIVTNSMTADIWDYQQYISGERLDGCMGIFAYLSAPITTAAALLIPYLYELQGFTSDWNILYDSAIRNKVFIITIVASAVTGLLSAIPYHFYDYTEERHEEIIQELQQRAKQLEIADNEENDSVNENVAVQSNTV